MLVVYDLCSNKSLKSGKSGRMFELNREIEFEFRSKNFKVVLRAALKFVNFKVVNFGCWNINLIWVIPMYIKFVKDLGVNKGL